MVQPTGGMSSVGEELSSVREKISKVPNTELITCHPSLVQIKLRQTEHRQVNICCLFPENYPTQPLIVELKSKTIEGKMLDGIVKVCDQELRSRTGKPQILPLVEFLNGFLSNNPFVVCSEELNYIKHTLTGEGDSMKVKHRTGVILYKAVQGSYFIDFKVTLPNDYPNKHVLLEVKETNFPLELMTVMSGHVKERLRQCIEPPLNRKPTDPVFEPRPSLQLAVDYIVTQCVRKYPLEKCSVCDTTALPCDPQSVVGDENHANYVYRIYCGHLYHRHCIEEHLKTPPFTGGKKCLVCGERVAHDKWNISPRLAEQRWAQHQARLREIDEVVDFLS